MIRDSFSGKDDRATCRYCDTHPYTKLADRTGAEFIVMREFPHRNVIFNSVPTYMADKPMVVAALRGMTEAGKYPAEGLWTK